MFLATPHFRLKQALNQSLINNVTLILQWISHSEIQQGNGASFKF